MKCAHARHQPAVRRFPAGAFGASAPRPRYEAAARRKHARADPSGGGDGIEDAHEARLPPSSPISRARQIARIGHQDAAEPNGHRLGESAGPGLDVERCAICEAVEVSTSVDWSPEGAAQGEGDAACMTRGVIAA